MRACAVRGLLYGDCSDHADSHRKDDLCYYHGKVEDGLTVPPGDYVDMPDFPSSALYSRESYARSTHPQFAHLVDTGGMEIAPVPAARELVSA